MEAANWRRNSEIETGRGDCQTAAELDTKRSSQTVVEIAVAVKEQTVRRRLVTRFHLRTIDTAQLTSREGTHVERHKNVIAERIAVDPSVIVTVDVRLAVARESADVFAENVAEALKAAAVAVEIQPAARAEPVAVLIACKTNTAQR